MAKTVNYTADQVKEMVKIYTAADSDTSRAEAVEMFADQFGKSVASIRAKLSREGVYVKKAAASKKGSKTLKADKVIKIADAMGKDADLVGDLEKLTHRTLDYLFEALN